MHCSHSLAQLKARLKAHGVDSAVVGALTERHECVAALARYEPNLLPCDCQWHKCNPDRSFPTASTCSHDLRLPPFRSTAALARQLTLAMHNSACMDKT